MPEPRPRRLLGHLLAAAAVAAATLVGLAVAAHASLADEAMLYSLAILIAAHAGRGPGLVAAGLSVVAFDFVFVEPRFTLDVADSRFVFTFGVMFVVGAAIGGLVARLREREQQTAALLELTRQTAAEKLRLAEAARDAEVRASTEELRNSLLSAVSHDLRTPLAAITGMATSLRETAPPSEHEGLDTIVDEAQRLSRILQNLLAVTKVEGGATPRRQWVPVEELVGSALGRLDDPLADRAIEVAIAGDLLAHVDPILGELLLVNLVDNAAKHTPPGTPIELSARRTGAATVIEVADRGPGLPAGAEHQVFERFFQAGSHRNGTGLGLAVCRGIAVAHGGAIEALHRDGGGAVFRVSIPDAEELPRLDEEPVLAAEAHG